MMRSVYVLDSYTAALKVQNMRDVMGKVLKFMLARADQYQDSLKMYVSFSNRKKLKGSEHEILSRFAREDLPLVYLFSKNEVVMEYSELDALYLLYLDQKEFKEFTTYLEQQKLPRDLFYPQSDLARNRERAFGIITSPKERKKPKAKK